MKKVIRMSVISLTTGLLLTACGGGGSSSSTPPVEIVDDQNTTEEVDDQNTTYEVDDQNTTEEVEDQNTTDEVEDQNTTDEETDQNNTSYIPTDVSDNIARSFLEKSTFGPDAQSVSHIQDIGIEAWVNEQLNAPSAYDSNTDAHKTYLERAIYIYRYLKDDQNATSRDAYVAAHIDDNNSVNIASGDWKLRHAFSSTWFENALDAEDQLRQRMAYALSQILIISSSVDTFKRRGEAYSAFYDILAKDALGNYRDLLFNVTKSPAMGLYLTSRGNQKANPETGRHPDENYAREVMQLFSIGLEQLNLDGTPILNSDGNPIPTYNITDIEEMARIFTGWDATASQITWGTRPNQRYTFGKSDTWTASFTVPMKFTAEYHDFGSKTVLGYSIEGVGGDAELRSIIDVLVDYPSTAPFISKQLIQRLVTSNPTPAYVERVASVFRDNGSGVSGDMKAVLKAILLDEEVFREHADSEYFGKAKEPMMAYIQMLRAFNVENSPPWKESYITQGVNLDGLYVFPFENVSKTFGQGPLMAPSVFNFYQSDFIANDDEFFNNGIVTPELQIQTAQIMINYSNKIRTATYIHEKLKLEINTRPIHYQDRYIIDFEEEVALVQSLLAHDSNGDIDWDSLSEDEGKEAINALLDSLNNKLVFGNMNEEEVRYLKEYLFNADYGRNYSSMLKIIRIAVNAVATSKSYMIQR